jgi:transposase-like protein
MPNNAEIILVCVRWDLRDALSYRDLEEMMQERGPGIDHTTIYRLVQRYAPELKKRETRSGSCRLPSIFATQPPISH